MAVFSLEQETAKVETVVFPEAFGKYGHLIADDAMLLVRGRFERDEESSRLLASELVPLDVVRDRAVREVQIRIAPGRAADRDAMRRLAAVLERFPGDRRVALIVDVNGQAPGLRVRAATSHRIQPSDRFVHEVEAICGVGTVVLK